MLEDEAEGHNGWVTYDQFMTESLTDDQLAQYFGIQEIIAYSTFY